MWSIGRLGYSTERLAAWAMVQIQDGRALLSPPPEAGSVSPQMVSNLAWGLSRVGHTPQPHVLASFLEASLALLQRGGSDSGKTPAVSEGTEPTFKPKELSALLSALVRWRCRTQTASVSSRESSSSPLPRILELVERDLSEAAGDRGLLLFFFSHVACPLLLLPVSSLIIRPPFV